VSWVKPFKYIGIWWEMFLGKSTWASGPQHGATTANARHYIDFAARHGFDHLLIEGWNKGWDGQWWGFGKHVSLTEAYPDFDLKAVIDYGRQKGVQLIGHHETGGNVAHYESQLDAAMALYGKLGVSAIKTGYVADAGGLYAPGDQPGAVRMEWHDGQFMSRHHILVLEAAARYHIAINTHEPIKDTGLRRTYPNWVSREGARGMEYNASTYWQNPPSHEPTLVFTRMLAGPMDYTPGILSLQGLHGDPLPSTLARQLALYVALYSPIQMAADVPEQLAKYPRELDFIRQVPVDWEDSKLIDGAVGEYAVLARKDRHSADWYIGGITDDHKRNVALTFDFLDPAKTYRATIYRDGDDADFKTDTRHHIVIETRRVKRGDQMMIRMAPGGGMALRLHPSR
jgi:alpha-glucosidase